MSIKILFKSSIAKILIIVLFLKIKLIVDFHNFFKNLCSYLLLFQILKWDISEKYVIYKKIP
jgi:hypothetical protein